MKKNDVETSFDNITTFRKISSQKISNEISSFFKTQLFPSLPEAATAPEPTSAGTASIIAVSK